MVLSYSKAAQYTTSAAPSGEGEGSAPAAGESSTPKVFAKQAAAASTSAAEPSTQADIPQAGPSTSTSTPILTPAPPSSVALSSAAPSTASPTANALGGGGTIKHLILDAGPLLSLTPLRHLAENLYTTPAVLAELRDPKAREYLQRIKDGLEGVRLVVGQPTGESMARVIAFAKKTGDYAVLSSTDLGVIALTLQYEMKENGTEGLRLEPGLKRATAPVSASQGSVGAVLGGTHGEAGKEGEAGPSGSGAGAVDSQQAAGSEEGAVQEGATGEEEKETGEEPAKVFTRNEDGSASTAQLDSLTISDKPSSSTSQPSSSTAASADDDSTPFTTIPTNASALSAPSDPSDPSAPAEDADSDSDAGDWITPSTLATHRSRDLGHLPEGGRASAKPLTAACMTGDFAVQNVLLAMGLGVVGEGGKRIGKVKSWVLRCHACFKTCKDPSKKFCPSCGNPTLLRTSTTTTSNGKTHLHLKKNYQYNLRGSKFTIPDAKPGRAKGQVKGGTGLILREDQREWVDAVRMEEGRKGKEEKKMLKGWDDPDWMPEIITVGMSGKGRQGAHGLPNIGHGRKNPNIAKKKR